MMDPSKRRDPQPMPDSRPIRGGRVQTKRKPCPHCGEMMDLSLKFGVWAGRCHTCRKSVGS